MERRKWIIAEFIPNFRGRIIRKKETGKYAWCFDNQ